KKVGIIGLSVGQSIALTLAMERGFGELRLTDFDTLDLSNLNRIRTGVHNLGIKKVVIAAREIAEIDPFLNVTCFDQGMTEENMDDFFTKNGKLDLLIDECDGLDMKIISRYKARELGIPVLMDTSDRGMLDVERYDLNPRMPILHGLIGDLDPKSISALSNEEKIPIVLQIAGAGQISKRGKASMIEVGQSISTWPQLASSVVLGGAVAADVTRRLLLGQFNDSGRYYIDLEELIGDKEEIVNKTSSLRPNPFVPLTKDVLDGMLAKLPVNAVDPSVLQLDLAQLHSIIDAANAAPSTGNDQPWKWYYKDRTLYLFHDQYRSFSFGDYRNIASYLTFGAVYENLVLAAQKQSVEVTAQLFPLGKDECLIASFQFANKPLSLAEPHVNNDLVDHIYTRYTNRTLAPVKEVAAHVLNDLKKVTESLPGAKLSWLTDPTQINEVGKIIAACDRMRLLNEEGHFDFVHREMRWTPKDAEDTRDGIDTLTLGLNTPQLVALGIIKDYKVIDFINSIKGGKVFEAATGRSVSLSSALGLITMPSISPEQYILGGRSYERMWLAAEKHGLAMHPVISPLYFFPRLLQGNGDGLSAENVEELKILRERFKRIFNLQDGLAEVFLFKIAYADGPGRQSLRIPVEQVLYTDK
ncbi:MAG: Rv1355c family protein, partial [Bacteroidota bacterium]